MSRLIVVGLLCVLAPLALAEDGKKKKAEKPEPELTKVWIYLSTMSKYNQQKIVDAAKTVHGVADAEPDDKNNRLHISIENGATVDLVSFARGLKGSGSGIKKTKLKIEGVCTVTIGAAMRGARKGRKGVGKQYTRADDLRVALLARPEISEVVWKADTRFEMTLVRPLAYPILAALLARHGSTESGSGRIVNLSWSGAPKRPTAEERAERKRRNKRNKNRRKKKQGEGAGELK